LSFRSLKTNSVLIKIIIAFPLALFVDILDYIPLGYLTPGLFQAADLISAFIFYFLIGPLAVIGLVDLVPIVGLFPTFTALVIGRFVIYWGVHK
jgi:hypothetical protein